MSVLAKVQRDFCQFILGHGHQNFMRHMKPTDLPKETLLDIYHHNIFSVHFRSLENDYPLVFSIMGESAARTITLAYVEASLPCIGSLEDWGAGFIAFIHRYGLTAEWPYLADIAQYEWAKHAAYCAAEDPLLTPADMSQLVTGGEAAVNFHFQKSCQLMAFSHPLEQIISIYQQEKRQPLLPTDRQGSSYALIFKHQGIIKVHWLAPSLFVFMNRLKEGQDIEVAYAAAQVLEPHFDAQKAFDFLLSHPILHR